MEILGLAKVRKVAPKLAVDATQNALDIGLEQLQAVVTNRYAVAARYARELKAVYRSEIERILEAQHRREFGFNPVRKMKVWLKQDAKDTPAVEREQLERLLEKSQVLKTIYTMRQELTRLWERSTLSREQLVKEMQDWCARAEASGIAALQDFAASLRRAAVA